MLLPIRSYVTLSSWHFGDLRNIYRPNIGEDQKKSSELSARPLAGILRHIMVNPALVNVLRS